VNFQTAATVLSAEICHPRSRPLGLHLRLFPFVTCHHKILDLPHNTRLKCAQVSRCICWVSTDYTPLYWDRHHLLFVHQQRNKPTDRTTEM